MKRVFLAALLCVGLAACAASEQGQPFQSAGAQANYQATRQYYASLIDGPAPNLAALTLMMTELRPRQWLTSL